MNIVMEKLPFGDSETDNYTNDENSSEARGAKIDEPNDFSQMLTMRFFVYCSIIVFGIILNMVVLIVYGRKLQKSTYIFLFSLALVDLFNCLLIILDILKSADVLPEFTTRAFCFAHAYSVDTGCLISAGVVLLLALDRFLKSKFLKHSLTRTQCLVLIVAVVISAIIVTSPFLISWTTKLLTLNDREMNLMCGRRYNASIYHHLKIHFSDTNANGLHGPRLFLLTSNAVTVILLLCAFLAMVILYVKMTSQIKGKSFVNRQKVSPVTGNKEPLKVRFSDAIRNSVIIDISAENSDISCSDMEDVTDSRATVGKSLESLDKNGNKKYRNCRDKNSSKESVVVRRKSSILSMKKRFPSKVLTLRYYILIVISILIFLFYLTHFLFNIVQICHFVIEPKNLVIYVLYDCLQHSYILCFILNPVIYSFFNRGFFRNFKRSFCCDKAQTNNRNRSSVDSSIV